MITWVRQLLSLVATMLVLMAVGVGIAQVVNAEGDNTFPRIVNSTDWTPNRKSPDPNLTYLYTPRDIINGKTTHILRNRTIGRNEGTRLRVYYNKQPDRVSISVGVVACELEANGGYAGRVQVVLGGQKVYDQPTRGKKVDELQGRYEWSLTDAGRARPYTLQYKDDVLKDSDRADQYSPVCQNFNNDYDYNRYNEGCSDANATGTRCANNGNENYSKKGRIAARNVGPLGQPFGGDAASNTGSQYAVGNKLDGRTFSVRFPSNFPKDGSGKMGFDPNTKLYYADLDVDLTAGIDASTAGGPSSMMQRITFNVVADNARAPNGSTLDPKMGYRYFNDEINAQRFFGLEGNGGRDRDFNGYGMKYALPFGPSCGASDQTGKIIVYDPDIGGYGDVYMAVYKRNPDNGNVTRVTDFNDIRAGNYIGPEKWIKSTASGSGSSSSFKLNMESGFQYMLLVINPKQPGKQDPSSNVFSVYLPTDSMNGLVNCRFNLVPKINGVKKTFNAYGDTLTGTGSVENAKPDSVAGEHNWKITKMVYKSRPADLDRRTVAVSEDTPCQFVANRSNNNIDCKPNLYNATYPDPESHDFSEDVGPYPAGYYVCFMASVEDPTWKPDDDRKRAYSTLSCSVAGVQPKVQAWGYDLKATGVISTSVVDSQTKRYGSWGEYGVMSNNKDTLMASGGGLIDTAANTPQQSWSSLTFAHQSQTGGRGFGWFNGVALPVVSENGAKVYTSRTVTSLNDLIFPLNPQKGIVKINGTLTINGNLQYPASVADITKLPRIVIIADDIVIGPNVTQIDPWLVATRIKTCSDVGIWSMSSANLDSTKCNKQLRFNGPVIADQIYLYRTFDTADGQPAEIFNLRADNFLSSYVGGGPDQPVASIDGLTELPPRF